MPTDQTHRAHHQPRRTATAHPHARPGLRPLALGLALLLASLGAAAQVQVAATLSVSAALVVVAPDGQPRTGRAVDVTIRVAATGDTVAFTVLEPERFVAGQRYPLVLHGHGFGFSRITAAGTGNLPTPGTSDVGVTGGVADLRANGYGVISIDQRGHGQSSGGVRVMDPDVEGRNLLAVLDWAEANLPWLLYRPSADGSDPRNLVVGAIGGSYGGMFQLLLAHIDPKRRLDAIVPEIAPHDLPYSLAPNSVPKSLWIPLLSGLGATAGVQTASTFDPFVLQELALTLTGNRITPPLRDFMAYHSTSYWCNGLAVATNGGPGTRPALPPTLRPRINALFVQGMRDTLFNVNNALANAQCLAARGGDVRLITTQVGHNTIPVIPDPGALLFQPPLDQTLGQCGSLQTRDARRAFLDEHLKGIVGAAAAVPREVCLSLSAQDAVLLSPARLTQPQARHTVPPTTVLAGVGGAPVVVPLGEPTGLAGEVVAGIPQVALTLRSALVGTPVGGEPILFAGIGVVHPGGAVELADNQLTPLRGLGTHQLPLAGVGERLKPGARLALLLYGAHEQYGLNGSVSLNLPRATVLPVSVAGTVLVPRQGQPLRAP